MVSYRVPRCTNQADKNSNNNISVNNNVILTISWHIQNPGTFNVRHIQNIFKYLR